MRPPFALGCLGDEEKRVEAPDSMEFRHPSREGRQRGYLEVTCRVREDFGEMPVGGQLPLQRKRGFGIGWWFQADGNRGFLDRLADRGDSGRLDAEIARQLPVRIIDPPTAYINVAGQLTVAFSSFMPLIDCKPDGSSNIYSIVVRDGKSNFTENFVTLQGRVPGVAVAAESCTSCGISKRSPTYLLTQDGEFRTQATLPLLPNVSNADNLNWRPIWTQ